MPMISSNKPSLKSPEMGGMLTIPSPGWFIVAIPILNLKLLTEVGRIYESTVQT